LFYFLDSLGSIYIGGQIRLDNLGLTGRCLVWFGGHECRNTRLSACIDWIFCWRISRCTSECIMLLRICEIVGVALCFTLNSRVLKRLRLLLVLFVSLVYCRCLFQRTVSCLVHLIFHVFFVFFHSLDRLKKYHVRLNRLDLIFIISFLF
jgi:hypothetical protein